MKIGHIIDKINDDQLFVPEFQREYVWKRENAKKLFESLIHKYPTGSLLTWETTEPPAVKGPRKYQPEMGSIKLILDGQQRVTTLYMIMEGRLPPYYEQHEVLNPILDLHVNIEDLTLEYFNESKMAGDPKWIKLTSIYQSEIKNSDIRKQMKSKGTLTDELEDRIDDHFETLKSIKEIEFPEQIIPVNADIEVAINIFYVVNASGVSLTDAELALAQICGYWPEARSLFKSKLRSLEKLGFHFRLDFIVYALLAVVHVNGSEMRKLHSKDNKEKVMAAWQQLDNSIINEVLNVLREHAFIEHTEEINSPYALLPIILYIFRKKNQTLTTKEKKKISKWFFYSQIRQRYTGSLQQKLDKDLAIVKNSEKPFEELLGAIKRESSLEIRENDLHGRNCQHPIFSLMRCYFKSQKAKCFNSGRPIFGRVERQYSLRKEQIFPYTSLKGLGYETNNKLKYALVSEMTNFVINLETDKPARSKETVTSYLRRANEVTEHSLSRQCIPPDEALWDINRFEDFLSARRKLLANELNSFLDSMTKLDFQYEDLELEDVIEQYESDRLEFKSTLRWDLEENRVNKSLETAVVKTVAAFNNGYSNGGMLVIGVEDDGNVIGLANDLNTFDGGTVDKFERHLRQVLTNHFDPSAVAKIETEFVEIDNKVVCAVKIDGGTEPLFVERQKNGDKEDKVFYYRNGNMSLPIHNSAEIERYIENRFGT